MRHFWLFILISSFASAQVTLTGQRMLASKDFELEDGRMIAQKVGCFLTETDDPVLVSIICLQGAFLETGVNGINDMILYANGKVRSAVDPESYRPSEFKMAYNPATRLWSLTSRFSSRESGVIKTSLMALDFDSAGNFVDIKRVY